MNQIWNKYGLFVVGGLLLMACLFLALFYGVNMPHMDDYDQVLRFVVDHENLTGLSDKILHIFSERNEHRASFYHLFTLLDRVIFGQINFKHYTFINVLFLGGITYLLYALFKESKKSNEYFAPILLFFLVPCVVVLNWPSAGMLYLPSLFLAYSLFI